MSDASPAKRPSRISLWLIVALTAAPVAASYLMFYVWPPERTVNYGELIEPRPLPDPPLATAGGAPFRVSQLKGKWVLVSVDRASCDAYCELKLLYMRQLRLTQGKNMDRIERLWLVSDDAPPRGAEALAAEGTRVVRVDAELVKAFPAPASRADHIYLVDPLGNLMMRFPRGAEPRLMIKDLARLLKASQVG
jgi:cytochrome oxidase Cu insertion factor (SCO1/SenC/PrrC family)